MYSKIQAIAIQNKDAVRICDGHKVSWPEPWGTYLWLVPTSDSDSSCLQDSAKCKQDIGVQSPLDPVGKLLGALERMLECSQKMR